MKHQIPHNAESAASLVNETLRLRARSAELAAEKNGAIREFAETLEKKCQYDGQCAALALEVARLEELLETFAHQHPELFGANKSIDLGLGRVGWKTNPPKLELVENDEESDLKESKRWSLVVDRLMGWAKRKSGEFKAAAERFLVMSRPTLDKREIIASAQEKGMAEIHLSAGVRVTQDETFFVEARKK